MQGHDVGALQQLVERHALVTVARGRAGILSAAIRTPSRDDFHAECRADPGNGAAEIAEPDDAEGLAVELADREVEQAELVAVGPRPVAQQFAIFQYVVRQREDQRKNMLRDRWRAVVANIADRDVVFPRRPEVDIVCTGGGQADQAQVGRARQGTRVQPHLVDQHDPGAGDALGHLPGGRVGVQLEIRQVANQRCGV